MDTEEVDIGTVRNLEASSWIPHHLQIDPFVASKTPQSLGGLTTPSAPHIIQDSLSNQSQRALTRVKTPPQLRQKSATSDIDLVVLDVDNLTKIRRWIVGVAVGKYWNLYRLGLQC